MAQGVGLFNQTRTAGKWGELDKHRKALINWDITQMLQVDSCGEIHG